MDSDGGGTRLREDDSHSGATPVARRFHNAVAKLQLQMARATLVQNIVRGAAGGVASGGWRVLTTVSFQFLCRPPADGHH